jgi:hypothetical protein
MNEQKLHLGEKDRWEGGHVVVECGRRLGAACSGVRKPELVCHCVRLCALLAGDDLRASGRGRSRAYGRVCSRPVHLEPQTAEASGSASEAMESEAACKAARVGPPKASDQ